MSKRSWDETQDAGRTSSSPQDQQLHPINRKRASIGLVTSPSSLSDVNGTQIQIPSGYIPAHGAERISTSVNPAQQCEPRQSPQQQDPLPPASSGRPEQSHPSVPLTITRKVKACAACRKQKIKCLMDNDRPPCRRCKERGLCCELNKSLQTHMDDESRWRNTVSHDLVHIHKALSNVLQHLSKPALPVLETIISGELNGNRGFDEASSQAEVGNDMCDMSPKLSPAKDSLEQVPIESLYELTRLRSLRAAAIGSDQRGEHHAAPPEVDDFIARGAIQLEEAEKLVRFYITRLDPYIYGIGSNYGDLQSLRRASPILTACLCTVSALHEPHNNKLYEVCNREFRRLVSENMFNLHLSVDYLRALCIGSYWLSDVSWTLSGMAVRGAGNFHLKEHYNRAITGTDTPALVSDAPDQLKGLVAIDRTRLGYLLYICDHHLSILYNRAPMIREDEMITGWKAYSESPNATDSDKRISSQVALLLIMSQIRDLFGTNTSEPIPKAFASHIVSFSQQLDKWLAQWSTALKPHDLIGDFPSKGVLLHYHFGKLHLCAHVFRGLRAVNQTDVIPPYFIDTASTALTAAISILELILKDDDLRNSLVGVPHYFHTMIAFAGVVLLKASGKYHAQLSIDLESIFNLTSRVISLFRSTACTRYHLVHWMAAGLEKMLQNCKIITARHWEKVDFTPIGEPGPGHSTTDNNGSWVNSQANGIYHGTEGINNHSPMLGNDFSSDLNMMVSYFPTGNDFDLGFDFLR